MPAVTSSPGPLLTAVACAWKTVEEEGNSVPTPTTPPVVIARAVEVPVPAIST